MRISLARQPRSRTMRREPRQMPHLPRHLYSGSHVPCARSPGLGFVIFALVTAGPMFLIQRVYDRSGCLPNDSSKANTQASGAVRLFFQPEVAGTLSVRVAVGCVASVESVRNGRVECGVEF